MAVLKYRDPTTNEWKNFDTVVGDTLPVGSIVDYDGTTVPSNWEEISYSSTIKVTEVGTDLNDYKEEGTYFFNYSVAPINVPAGSNGWLQVLKCSSIDNSSTYVKQTWFRLGTINSNDFQKYERTYSSSSDTWSNWSVLNNSVYSTSEYRIGTWIDGKPIYRKVINYTTKPTTREFIITTGITNLNQYTDIIGMMYRKDNITHVLPRYTGNETVWDCYLNDISATQIQVAIGSNLRNSTYWNKLVLILEYTKTTD